MPWTGDYPKRSVSAWTPIWRTAPFAALIRPEWSGSRKRRSGPGTRDRAQKIRRLARPAPGKAEGGRRRGAPDRTARPRSPPRAVGLGRRRFPAFRGRGDLFHQFPHSAAPGIVFAGYGRTVGFLRTSNLGQPRRGFGIRSSSPEIPAETAGIPHADGEPLLADHTMLVKSLTDEEILAFDAALQKEISRTQGRI